MLECTEKDLEEPQHNTYFDRDANRKPPKYFKYPASGVPCYMHAEFGNCRSCTCFEVWCNLVIFKEEECHLLGYDDAVQFL
jgi:hypothetical protein